MKRTGWAKPFSPLGMWVGLLALGVIVAFVGGALGLRDNLYSSVGLSLFVGTVGAVLALMWWRRGDEAVREAHRWAWYWGGSRGMGLSLVVMVLVLVFKPQWLVAVQTEWTGAFSDSLSPFGLGLLGGMVVMLLMSLIGYLIAWAIWWRRHS